MANAPTGLAALEELIAGCELEFLVADAAVFTDSEKVYDAPAGGECHITFGMIRRARAALDAAVDAACPCPNCPSPSGCS